MQRYESFEGICKYCGESDILMAESQLEADEEVSRKCECGGWEAEEKQQQLIAAIRTQSAENTELNFKKLDEAQVDMLIDIGILVLEGKIDKATIAVKQSTVVITGGVKIKVQRKAMAESTEEI